MIFTLLLTTTMLISPTDEEWRDFAKKYVHGIQNLKEIASENGWNGNDFVLQRLKDLANAGFEFGLISLNGFGDYVLWNQDNLKQDQDKYKLARFIDWCVFS